MKKKRLCCSILSCIRKTMRIKEEMTKSQARVLHVWNGGSILTALKPIYEHLLCPGTIIVHLVQLNMCGNNVQTPEYTKRGDGHIPGWKLSTSILSWNSINGWKGRGKENACGKAESETNEIHITARALCDFIHLCGNNAFPDKQETRRS